MRKLLKLLSPAFSVVVLGVALWFLHRELAGMSRDAIAEHIRSLPILAVIAAALLTCCSYLTLTVYDTAALNYIGKRLPYRRSALTAFMAYAVGNNVGVAALSGGAIRYRMYTLAGLTSTEIAQIIAFVSVTFALGTSLLLGVTLLLLPATETALLKVPQPVQVVTGAVLLGLPLLYVAAAFWRAAPLRLGSWAISMPTPRIASTQIAASVADMLCAAGTLYVLLRPELGIGYLPFLGIFLLAVAAGLISSVPGGIGVFEAVLVAALPQIAAAPLLATIIVYRLIYYVLPLLLALAILVVNETRQHRVALGESSDSLRRWLSGITPQAIAITIFLAGLVLLVSGASPGIESRLSLVASALPLPILELSHLAGSVVGFALLIIARGLYRRLRGAYKAAMIALIVGAAASLLKGLDYEEAIALLLVALGLRVSREQFFRLGSIAAQRFNARWVVSISVVMLVAIWVTLVSYRHLEYSNELWWQFALHADAPRSLRAGVLAAVLAFGFALWKLLRSQGGSTKSRPIADDIEDVRKVLASAEDTSANLALLGDKRFLWSADRQAFIMYQVCGDSWIAMGDPLGPANQRAQLAWEFVELVDQHDGRPVFYQVTANSLAIFADLGMAFAKLGEIAKIPLHDFSLQGSQQAELRQALSRGRRSGAVFEVVPRAELPPLLEEIKDVSDSWLSDKSGNEKGFSLGFFSADYLACFDCAVARVEGRIVAFANLWTAPASGELSVDLMRYNDAAPKGIMDFLFVELMQWGKDNNFAYFNMGVAPLAGLERRAIAPLWNKLGNLIFSHGETFYNFEGLRRYKSKFGPEWEPRYLACPAGLTALPLALLDVSRLISGSGTKALKN